MEYGFQTHTVDSTGDDERGESVGSRKSAWTHVWGYLLRVGGEVCYRMKTWFVTQLVNLRRDSVLLNLFGQNNQVKIVLRRLSSEFLSEHWSYSSEYSLAR